jgi:speckle-type POZ protein
MCDPLKQGMSEAWEQVKEMRDREEEANQRAGFLEQGFGAAWMEGAHTDIVVKPGNGPPIPAHKAILVSRHFSIIDGPLGFGDRVAFEV